ncbi:Fic family protein [Poseidonibacter ostreae]|uniref:Fic family protein n=1 Tax=Poseidonibacter ostreae TaxID=2654171 RepID=A0A6L4WN33_9BACT|nr:Fic family protein [Poseidonibacter ostreae]KAB7884321.1 Fic family protein [Poseidonibacter ostreae]KAB7884471.1 Fic family protein [Poseidonibacter ostreae]KAB7886462.1 Fic family protein [Poseidonibacter ostreae]
MSEFIPNNLPLEIDIETKAILKKSITANKALANLNGIAKIIPNQTILINSLILQEAKDSSEIENIITTHDELYQSNLDISNISHATKEVQSYSRALLKGFDLVRENSLLLTRHIIDIQQELEGNVAGVRQQIGTVLKNQATGEVIHTPPQDEATIRKLLNNLEHYINTADDVDPLIKMAIIHYQFESIHPFYDGNGRTGRIINILYLVLNELLDLPILYLSSYIIKHKADYYRLLQEVREKDSWEEWIIYLLDGVEQTAIRQIKLINAIKQLMDSTKIRLKKELPKIYSKDLLEVLFIHPYTKIDMLVDNLGITRQTASKHLKELDSIGLLEERKIKNSKFYINKELFIMLQKGI